MPLQSVNPKNKQLIKKFDELSDEQIAQKIALAQKAFESWKEVPFVERQKYMYRVAEILREKKAEYARIITDEVGKTLAASEAEVEKCALTCDYYAQNAEEFLSPEKVETDASNSYIRFDPIGIVLAVMPWNFPFWQVFRFAAPALMAGNVGVLKHASNVQLSAFAMEEVFRLSGFPEGAFINLCIGSAKVEQVIRDPRVKAVTLTGSEKAGASVASIAGQEIKKTVLELGGSDPFIVLADADIDAAVAAAVTTRMQYNAGQSCISAKRFIVEETIAEDFTTKLKAAVEVLAVGDPLDQKTIVGPLANQQGVDEIQRQVNDSARLGAQIVSGGERGDELGYYYQPTIITNCQPGMPVYDEETFGPVFAIITIKDYQEAISVANSSPYGLGATVFSADFDMVQKQIVPRLDSGLVLMPYAGAPSMLILALPFRK